MPHQSSQPHSSDEPLIRAGVRQQRLFLDSSLPSRILFHGDFDGIASAALLVRFFANDPILEPVEYSIKRRWLHRHLESAAVVDFLFHPEAQWWFDHHLTSFVSPKIRALYHSDAQHRWDPEYGSCPQLILDVLGESRDVTELRAAFREWIYWSDIIDSARYESPKQAVLGDEPEILINQALAESLSRELRISLVRRIARGETAATIVLSPELSELYTRFRQRQTSALELMKSRLQRVGPVGTCDLTDRPATFVRYGVYLLDPTAEYSVTAYHSGRKAEPYKIALGASPWLLGGAGGRDLGEVAARFGGGGRRSVGSVSFSDRDACLKATQDIVATLAARGGLDSDEPKHSTIR